MAVYKLMACGKDYIWGGHRLKTDYGKQFPGDVWAESWELSCHPDGETFIASGRLSGATLAQRIEAERSAHRDPVGYAAGGRKDFPLLIKLINTGSDLSVQVHPDDAYAMAHEDAHGKTEMWLVLDCEPGAGLCYGVKRAVTRSELAAAIADETFTALLNIVPVQKGDVYLIEPGTVHAVGAGITLVEVQQNSNIAYRVYDYGRLGADGKPRPLHIEKALDVMQVSPSRNDYDFGGHVCKCPWFTVDKIEVQGSWEGMAGASSFQHLLALEGSGRLLYQGEEVPFAKGDSLFAEAGSGSYCIEGDCTLLLTYLEPDESGKQYRIGVDLGGTNIDVGVVDAYNRIVSRSRCKTRAQRHSDEVLADIIATVRSAVEKAGIGLQECGSLGIGCPGLTDAAAGTLVYAPNLGWEDIPLAELLERALGLPVYLSNDANCAALGEVCAGAAKGCKNAVMVTLGTGVGGGIVIDGKLFEGGGAGGTELGHTTIVVGGEPCSCGRRGCLEAYASATALIRHANRAAKQNPDSLLNTLCGGKLTNLQGEHVFAAAAQGDPAACQVLEDYVLHLGEGLVNVVNLFRPEKLLLAGGVAAAGAALTDPLNAYVARYAYAGSRAPIPPVEVASLEGDAGIIGAANLGGG